MVRDNKACKSGFCNCSVKAMAKGEGRTGGAEEERNTGAMTAGFSGMEPMRKIMSMTSRSGRVE